MNEQSKAAHRRAGLSEGAQLALDFILHRNCRGIPIWQINPMEWRAIDAIAGVPEGSYEADPKNTYRRMLVNSACCMLDQWIPENPLSMGTSGYQSEAPRTATTGIKAPVVDGIVIDSPEAAVQHMESTLFPRLLSAIRHFDPAEHRASCLAQEREIRDFLEPDILKAPYSSPFASFPCLAYWIYGYENYFMAYALYPEIMERHFKLQADLAVLRNQASAEAIREENLPPCIRLDHDMADGRGTLVGIESLDRIWFPHFERSIRPFVEAGITLLWHCDGNLMKMIPRLIECGVSGFQGFQYEYGMDYEEICRMKTREGDDLLIVAGVSVTTTLPHGSPSDVRREMQWLVEKAPRRGLMLGASSSITPGVPLQNLKTMIEGFWHYRTHGKSQF